MGIRRGRLWWPRREEGRQGTLDRTLVSNHRLWMLDPPGRLNKNDVLLYTLGNTRKGISITLGCWTPCPAR